MVHWGRQLQTDQMQSLQISLYVFAITKLSNSPWKYSRNKFPRGCKCPLHLLCLEAVHMQSSGQLLSTPYSQLYAFPISRHCDTPIHTILFYTITSPPLLLYCSTDLWYSENLKHVHKIRIPDSTVKFADGFSKLLL